MKLQGRALEQIAGAYTLGTLGPLASRRFETVLERDLNARRAWLQWQQHLSVLALDLPNVRPEAGTWQKIEAQLEKTSAPPKRRGNRWLLLAALLAALAVALVWMRT